MKLMCSGNERKRMTMINSILLLSLIVILGIYCKLGAWWWMFAAIVTALTILSFL